MQQTKNTLSFNNSINLRFFCRYIESVIFVLFNCSNYLVSHKFRPKYSFLSPDGLSGRNDVTLDKVNFRPDIRQSFFWKKIRTSRVLVALKTIWRYCTLINIKLGQAHIHQHPIEPQ